MNCKEAWHGHASDRVEREGCKGYYQPLGEAKDGRQLRRNSRSSQRRDSGHDSKGDHRIANLPHVKLVDPYQAGLSREEGLERRRQGMTADVMIASANAITLDGKLVNLDGMGNRVAAMAFGPRKVILVVGMNKVAPDLDSAIARVKHYAAPVNAIRLGIPTPCVETGLCADCKSPQRICNIWTIIEGHMVKDRIHVKLVGENLGY